MYRILYVNPVSYIGGGEKALLELMENLPSEEYMPILLCPGDGHFPVICRNKGIEIHYLPTIPFPGGKAITTYKYLALNAIKIANFVARLKIDLVHSNSARVAYHGGLGARMAGVPSIIHIRDYINSPFQSRLKALFLNRISDRIIAVSEATKVSILSNNHFLQNKTVTVYDGIPYIEQPSNEQIKFFLKSLKSLSQGPILAVIGAISKQKGQSIIIRALPEIKKLFPGIILLIIGTPRDSQGVIYENQIHEEVKQMGLSGHVIFLGFREDVQVIIKSADLIVHPAVEPDAFPHILLEACFLQTPVVASAIGGIPEIIEDRKTGYLFTPGDINGLSALIIQILSHTDMITNVCKLGKEKVSESFSMRKHIDRITELYKTLLN